MPLTNQLIPAFLYSLSSPNFFKREGQPIQLGQAYVRIQSVPHKLTRLPLSAQLLTPWGYSTLTDTSGFHVLSVDYRGYGKSTGSPSEAGLIQDGIATVDWAMSVAGVASERIVVVGQSLGTAVTSGVVEHFAARDVEFAGVICEQFLNPT